MKAITLRNLPPEVARRVQERARTRGESLNRAVIGLLQEGLGLAPGGKKPRIHHDLDFMIGTWTKEEAAEFNRRLAEQRQIDPEMWR